MPYEITAPKEDGVFEVRIFGTLIYDEIFAYATRVISDPAWTPESHILSTVDPHTDIGDFTLDGFENELAPGLRALQNRRGAKSKEAIVSDSEVLQSVVKMWAFYARDHDMPNFRFCRSRQEALAWIRE